VKKMREPKEIAKDLEVIHIEMNKWLHHLGRESAKAEWDKLVKKEVELGREFDKSLEEKYKIR
jgi:hypothetical protein